ncbi:MAG: YfhO family protein, partial [Oscillospiraceae bacterium]|nr:YfhO family protein [Oscillospiraceae bacterium]
MTYDSYMSAEEYDAARCSLLPYLMLESALTERGGQSSDGAIQTLEAYACDFTLDKAFVKENSIGMEVYQHDITLNQDVSDCFLYLDVTDVHCRYPEFFAGKTLKIRADESEKLQFTLWNENCNWPWMRKADRYSFNLGYRENGLKTLSFEFSAEYGDMKLYAIPASVLTDACAARTAETLEQVTFGRNTLDGDITVPSKKLLSVSLLHNDGWRVYVDGREQPL